LISSSGASSPPNLRSTLQDSSLFTNVCRPRCQGGCRCAGQIAGKSERISSTLFFSSPYPRRPYGAGELRSESEGMRRRLCRLDNRHVRICCPRTWLTAAHHSTANYYGRASSSHHTTLENTQRGGRETPSGKTRMCTMRGGSRS
jgi:hypothetical protein